MEDKHDLGFEMSITYVPVPRAHVCTLNREHRLSASGDIPKRWIHNMLWPPPAAITFHLHGISIAAFKSNGV